MLFNSIQFVIFFPIAIWLYFIIPYKFKNVYLLAVSYFYYMSWEISYALLLAGSTLVCYFGAIAMEKIEGRIALRKLLLAGCVLLNLAILFVFKYLHLFLPEVKLSLVLPVGISFYIFRSVSYIADVYNKKIEKVTNFIDYALYVSFFPQLVAGPIERATTFFEQLYKDHSFNYDRFKLGLLRMLWGYFLKLVISERMGIAVDLIYDNYHDATGYQLILGTVLYAFQIYTDFYSYSEIAIGASVILGFDPIENFRQPFFAKNCRELWQRWHISLNSWFVEYVYIPLGGSRKGKFRKNINTIVVFLLSGLWHGADFSYVLWGGLSGLFQILFPGKSKKDNLERQETKLCKLGGILLTFIAFNAALIFFRADSISMGIEIYEKIFTEFGINSILTTSIFDLGLGVFNMLFLIVAMIVLFVIDVLKEKGYIYSDLFKMPLLIRWGVYFLLSIMILLSAHLGAAEFIYFQF